MTDITLPRAIAQEVLDALDYVESRCGQFLVSNALRAALAQPMTDGEYKAVGEQIRAQPQAEPQSGACVMCGALHEDQVVKYFPWEAQPATQPIPAPAERERLRAAQADAVMPLIGPLLDAWESYRTDDEEAFEELDTQLRKINRAMEDAVEAQPATQPDADDFSGPMLVEWLKNKYKRHHELEDLKAAEMLESLLKAQPATQPDNEADELLRNLGLDPDIYRTDGGYINHLKVKAAILHPDRYPVQIVKGCIKPECFCADERGPSYCAAEKWAAKTVAQSATQPTTAPVGEPVGHLNGLGYTAAFMSMAMRKQHVLSNGSTPSKFTIPVYLAPQPRKLLTDEQIDTIEERIYCRTIQKGKTRHEYTTKFARAIEAAHGITGGQA